MFSNAFLGIVLSVPGYSNTSKELDILKGDKEFSELVGRRIIQNEINI